MLKKLSEYELNEIIFNSSHVKVFDSTATDEIESYILKLSEESGNAERDDEFNAEVIRILQKRGH